MAELTATIQLKHGMTWAELVNEATEVGVPDNAEISTYHYDAGGDPRESDYTNIIFTWGRRKFKAGGII